MNTVATEQILLVNINNSAGSKLQCSYCLMDLSIILSVGNDWQISSLLMNSI